MACSPPATGPIRTGSGRSVCFLRQLRRQVPVPRVRFVFAVAVRSGAVTASVTEPEALALVMLALGAGVVRAKDGRVEALTLRSH